MKVQQTDDLVLMKNPDKWINYPVLPIVKRNHNNPECAILICDNQPKVYLVNMFSLKTGFLSEILKDVPTKSYDTFEDLINDGWEVD